MGFPTGISEAYRQELLCEQRVRRATSKAPLATLEGVVSSLGGCCGHRQGERLWTLWFWLIAWRLDGGTVSHRKLKVYKFGTMRTLGSQSQQIEAHTAVTMRARVLIENEMNEPHALLIGKPAPTTVRVFNSIIRELTRPIVVTDSILGKFTLNRSLGSFEGATRWRRKRVPVNVSASDERKFRARLPRLVKIVENAEWWHEWMKREVAPRVMDVLQGWAEEDFPAPSERDLLAVLTLAQICLYEDGGVTLVYDLGDYAGGHQALVQATLAGKFKDLELIG